MYYLIVPTCKPLNNIANGAVKVSDFSNGSIALYICDEGYDIAGAAIRRCLNGSWTDEEPFCRIAGENSQSSMVVLRIKVSVNSIMWFGHNENCTQCMCLKSM